MSSEPDVTTESQATVGPDQIRPLPVDLTDVQPEAVDRRLEPAYVTMSQPALDPELLKLQIRSEEAKVKRLELENARINDENAGQRVESDQRGVYGRAALTIAIVWLGVVLAIVIASGSKALALSDQVLVALITSTTVNVLGFAAIVYRYLFHRAK
ncbi:MAG: hypothetical protein SFX74_09815 [Fimbriimonadaceae bacterium]|nr:hypothetical protein [Fimbriimonadaceae bacterium]